ncbi:MAG: hypothetical protein M3Y87_14475 [Myxococcota bacterium]|nr:hypothetical protein [Myxococcota bacterium]
MYGSRRDPEAQQRSIERRRREDEAPRLSDEVPNLETLALEIAEAAEGAVGGTTHVRRVQVASAPALFEMTCGTRDCKNGGHDLTSEIMRGLRASKTRFEGSDACSGASGSSECSCVLKYVATATYRGV